MFCIYDCYHDTASVFRLFGGIKEGMEVGKGTSPSTAAAPASAHLSSFLCKKDLGSGFKTWHAKGILCHGVLWKMIISRIIHAILLAEFPKAVKEPGEYETVITLSPSLCFGA